MSNPESSGDNNGDHGNNNNPHNNQNINPPPRPHIPPGHNSPVRTPHPHDVLSGRGGRINSHPGNVRFREMVDEYKRAYLDPRTKKAEKARIAARIVGIVRALEPGGRFLKEDPHTGLWVEIGDERAWKKAGQALRESAPEIRAERQAALQMLVAGAMGGGGGGGVVQGGGGGAVGGGGVSMQGSQGGGVSGGLVDLSGGGSVSSMSNMGGMGSSSMSNMGGAGNSKSNSGGSSSRKSRAADPPGPRHRPNPPEREGLARTTNSRHTSSSDYNNNNEAELNQQRSNSRNQSSHQSQQQQTQQQQQQMAEEDLELARMRQEYMQMQRLQAEQQRKMQQYQAQLAGRGMGAGMMGSGSASGGGGGMSSAGGGGGGGSSMGSGGNNAGSMGSGNSGSGGGNYGQDVYDEYQQMQQGLMGTYRQQVHQTAQAQLAANREQQMGQIIMGGGRNHQDIAAQIMSDGLLPVDAGFDIPALRGDHNQGGYVQQQQQQYSQNQQQQQGYGQRQGYQNNNYNQSNPIQAQEAFDRHFNSCDKTVSTMSSFDIQSMDMSSLGGLSWNQNSNYNMSGLISTGSQMSSNRYNNYNASGGTGRGSKKQGKGKSSKSGGGKSALERKLEKINRQQASERQQMMERQLQQAQAQQLGHVQMEQGQAQGQGPMEHSGMAGGAHVVVPTAGPSTKSTNRGSNNNKFHQDSNNSNNNNSSNQNMSSHHNMSSLHSFGFEAIEEDELTEASYKMSNLGLSEMDMTFGSDALSVRSKSEPKMRVGDEDEKQQVGERANMENDNSPEKRSNFADGAEVHAPDGNGKKGVTASRVFNQSLSSTSNSSKSSMKQKLRASNYSMEEFNESFKSMEMEESQIHSHSTQRTQRDPDGEVGGTYGNNNKSGGSAKSRKKDPSGGRLPGIHSTRTSHQGAPVAAAGASRRESVGSLSMRLSDPDILNSNKNLDFGVSLESLRSFQSHDSNDNDGNNNNKSNDQFNDSDASSWLNQYNSMENIGSDKSPWDDEDQAQDASDGTSMSEISAPRMVTASGGGE